MKDRIVQYPNRYKLTPVSGSTDTYDFQQITGTVTEVGTPYNKANVLDDSTASLLNLVEPNATVNKALEKITTYLMPIGGIIMWSGAISNIPIGWKLCDGTGGTPDLRNRFIVGAGSTYSVNQTGGQDTINTSHTHTTGTVNSVIIAYADGSPPITATTTHSHTVSTNGDTFDNKPPYYALAYIMRVAF